MLSQLNRLEFNRRNAVINMVLLLSLTDRCSIATMATLRPQAAIDMLDKSDILSFVSKVKGRPMMELHTANLKLRPCIPSDRQDFIDLERDPEVMRFLNGGAVDHEKTDPEKVTFRMPRGIEPDVWTVLRIEDGVFVGWFFLASEDDAVAEIGYRLRRDAWGKGYASEAALKLVGWAFEATNIEKLVACTMATNTGSRRVMEKIGMRHARTVPFEDPSFPDTDQWEVWYEITRSEWERA